MNESEFAASGTSFLDTKTAAKLFRESFRFRLHAAISRPRSRNLVVVQCSESFSHSWAARRGHFDLLLNIFDTSGSIDQDLAAPSFGVAEYITSQAGTKCTAVSTMLRKIPRILYGYDYVALLDDDVELNVETISSMFSRMRNDRLSLAQPTLDRHSQGWWPALRAENLPHQACRISAVEIMMPFLSSEALRVGGDAFDFSVSGYGADLLLAYLLRTRGHTRFAVYRDIQAHHPQLSDLRSGAFYSFLQSHGVDPEGELEQIRMQFPDLRNIELEGRL